MKELLQLLNTPDSGLVLDANKYHKLYRGTKTTRAAFRLITNACQREVVTLWGLFDHRREYELCGKGLAAEIRLIRKDKRFGYVATGSPVAKELLDYIHAWIEVPELIETPTYAFSRRDGLPED